MADLKGENLLDILIKRVLESEIKDSDMIDMDKLKKLLRVFLTKIESKFKSHHRSYDKLFQKEANWLDLEVSDEVKKRPQT